MLHARDYVIEEYTRTVCPDCAKEGIRADREGTFVDGMLVSHSGKIWMRRFCAKHGENESLYEESAEIFRARNGWQTPTSQIIPDRADNFGGFPEGYRHGLPASHGQHSCILLLNLTENCNYKCPTCYASALDPGIPMSDRPTMSELLHTVDTVIEREGGKLSVVMLSGGEPTLRKDLPEIIGELSQRPITRIMLNTNGRRIHRDAEFRKFLATNREKIEVYLQFDGLEDATYQSLRGEPLAKEKLEVLAMLNKLQVFTTLVMTIKRGVNEHEIKAVFEHGRGTPYCSGIAFQPVFGSGRDSGIDPRDRTTPSAVIKALEMPNDFIPLPCSHRDCCDIGYFIKDKKGDWKSLIEIVGRERMREWIHLVSNTISFENVRESLSSLIKEGVLQRVFSEQQRTSSLQIARDLFMMCDCVPGVRDLIGSVWPSGKPNRIEEMATNTFRVTVKMFMDAHTFHESRIRQCCVHVGSFEEDPRRTSFCWRWLFEDSTDFPARVSQFRLEPK